MSAASFRELHAPGRILVLPNAWDAGSARLLEACGAEAIATTSAGLCWAHGYPDGGAFPPALLLGAVREIARVVRLPLSVDIEGGYSADPAEVAELISALVDAGAVGVNLEDGTGAPEALAAKIEAAKRAALRAGVDLFVNARCDVMIRRLVPPERAVAEAIARGERYRDAGCDGLFVPLLADPEAMRAIAGAVDRPLNVLVVAKLPPVAELRACGVRRLSAGSAVCQAALGAARRATKRLLEEGSYDAFFEGPVTHPEMNALLAPRP